MYFSNLLITLAAAGIAASSPAASSQTITAVAGSGSASFSSVPASTTSAVASASSTAEPCAQISAALAQNVEQLNANIALACLRSVKVATQDDVLQLQGLQALLPFQSTLVYLKDPPPGYLYPGVDIMGSLSKIISDVQNGVYQNEYDVQIDAFNLLTSAHDFHLVWEPDIVNVFSWKRSESLISVSPDGLSLPSVYGLDDLEALRNPNASGYRASAVVQINGVEVETWMNQYAALNPWDHDPDANYNNVVRNIVSTDNGQGYGDVFTWSYNYQGDDTILTFANGTTRHVETYATTDSNFSGVTDGESFFSSFCTGPPAASSSSAAVFSSVPVTSSAVAVTSSAAVGSTSPIPTVSSINLFSSVVSETKYPAPSTYPKPVVIAPGNTIAGYFPDDHSDLAVLTVPTFMPDGSPNPDNYPFQNTLRSFLATAKANGKTKLVIDLRGNGGGQILDGYDMFRQLFPSMAPFSSTNMAAFPLFNVIGEVASALVGSGKISDGDLGALSEFDYRTDLTAALQDYDSWEDFYGPVEHYGGNFTNLRSYNLSDPGSLGFPIYGYINDTQPQSQVFEAENMVILSDAFCGSTCALFAEFMKTQGGVQAIAVGGRKQTGPMQWVGGSKGANDQPMSGIAQTVEEGIQYGDAAQKALFKPYLSLIPAVKAMEDRLGIVESSWTDNLNFQNNIRKGDETFTPLQFVYEAADCRFFYTADMLADQTVVWDRVYSLRWQNGTCVQGSTGQASSAKGFDNSYITSYPPIGANNTFGANDTYSYPGAYSIGEHPTSSSIAATATSASTTTAGGSPTQTVAPSKGAAVKTVGGVLSSFFAIVIALLWM